MEWGGVGWGGAGGCWAQDLGGMVVQQVKNADLSNQDEVAVPLNNRRRGRRLLLLCFKEGECWVMVLPAPRRNVEGALLDGVYTEARAANSAFNTHESGPPTVIAVIPLAPSHSPKIFVSGLVLTLPVVCSSTGTSLQIHYNGWPPRWDEWLRWDSPRIAPFRTRTQHLPHSQHVSPAPISAVRNAPITGMDDVRVVMPEVSRVLQEIGPMVDEVKSVVLFAWVCGEDWGRVCAGRATRKREFVCVCVFCRLLLFILRGVYCVYF